MSWTPLDPYSGPPEDEELTGLALIREVAFLRETADLQGVPHDPEWDRWLADDPAASLLLQKARRG